VVIEPASRDTENIHAQKNLNCNLKLIAASNVPCS
jgi:hypothetical protein